MEGDFTAQAVDKITGTGWASSQGWEAGDGGKLVTQEVRGGEAVESALPAFRRKRNKSTGQTSLKPRTPKPSGNVITGDWDPRRGRGSRGQEPGGRDADARAARPQKHSKGGPQGTNPRPPGSAQMEAGGGPGSRAADTALTWLVTCKRTQNTV